MTHSLIQKIMADITEDAMPAGEFAPRIQVMGLRYIEAALRRHIDQLTKSPETVSKDAISNGEESSLIALIEAKKLPYNTANGPSYFVPLETVKDIIHRHEAEADASDDYQRGFSDASRMDARGYESKSLIGSIEMLKEYIGPFGIETPAQAMDRCIDIIRQHEAEIKCKFPADCDYPDCGTRTKGGVKCNGEYQASIYKEKSGEILYNSDVAALIGAYDHAVTSNLTLATIKPNIEIVRELLSATPARESVADAHTLNELVGIKADLEWLAKNTHALDAANMTQRVLMTWNRVNQLETNINRIEGGKSNG